MVLFFWVRPCCHGCIRRRRRRKTPKAPDLSSNYTDVIVICEWQFHFNETIFGEVLIYVCISGCGKIFSMDKILKKIRT